MSLLAKVRTLVGALVHKPFAPRLEKVDLAPPDSKTVPQQHTGLESREADVAETERVADLIAQQKQDVAKD